MVSNLVWLGMDTGLLGLGTALPHFWGIGFDNFRRGWIVGGLLSFHGLLLS